MEATRLQGIEKIVEDVRSKYQTSSNQIDWDKLSDDYDILYLTHPKFFVPVAMKLNGMYIVFVTPLVRSCDGIDHRAHEFGHILLEHLDAKKLLTVNEQEQEADYFAEKLVGHVPERYSSNILQRLFAEIRYPVASYRSSLGDAKPWNQYLAKHIRNLAKKELKRREGLEVS